MNLCVAQAAVDDGRLGFSKLIAAVLVPTGAAVGGLVVSWGGSALACGEQLYSRRVTRSYVLLIWLLLTAAALWPSSTSARVTSVPPQGPEAIALLNQQRAANGIPPVTDNQSFAAAWCPDEEGGPSGGELGRDLSSAAGWTATTSPWDNAPLHQQDLYNPLFTQAGDVNVGNSGCFGAGAPAPQPSAPTFYDFISEKGNGAVPASETIYGEGPFAPQQAVGIRLGVATGPDILLYGLGFPQETLFAGVHVTGWSLRTAAGESVPDVRLVDAVTVAAYGYPGYLAGDVGIMIPPVLRPATEYVGSAVWQGPSGATATQGFSFDTTLTPNTVTLYPGYKWNRAGRWTGQELIGVSSEAPNPVVTATRRGKLIVVKLHLTSRSEGTGYYLGVTTLSAGPWLICVKSGGGTTGYETASHCQTFRVAHRVH